ncbi:MAG: 2,4-dienoyl-CoA reductase [Christensenellaceae bacterium]|nr:2,4-dienoyl-CoA reductase [Christensenellaceae bacterium]
MSNKNTPLAQPFKVGPRMAKNRFVIQPMECDDALPNGLFSEKSYARYAKSMRGGAGIVVMESVTMQREHRARIDQILIDIRDEENKQGWIDFCKAMKEIDPETLLIVQLNHSGEVSASSFSEKVCVKPLYGFEGRLMTEEYVEETLELYAQTTKFLYDAGFDGVDIKACHGYFISQLVRPYNDRDWAWGGSWENRSKFPFKLMERIRELVPDENFLIGAKVSMFEGQPGGQGHAGPDSPLVDLDESYKLIKGLEERGCSFFIESLGSPSITWELMSPNKNNAFDVYMHMTMADKMKKALKPETCVILGGISILERGKTNGLRGVCPEWNSMFHWGNYLIEHGNVDMISLGRQSIADSELPIKYIEDREDEINWCVCCDGCGELMVRQVEVGCIVHDKYYTKLMIEQRKKQKLSRVVTGDE